MIKSPWILPLALACLTLSGRPLYAGFTCGSEALICGDEERCCEHAVAVFIGDTGSGPSYVEGKCIPKPQHCGDYWCGNRHCQAGLFGTPNVCCVTNRPGLSTDYRCAYSELSCPGNTEQLNIRDRTSSTARPLQRG